MPKQNLQSFAWNPNPECAAHHFGLWAVQHEWIVGALSTLRAGMWAAVPAQQAQNAQDSGYMKTQDGIAITRIMGQIMKGASKFGGTNSIHTRRSLAMAANDPEVHGMLMVIDSPGGTVAGTDDTAQAMRYFTSKKPLYVQAEDLMASAAYWIGCQADYVAATATTEVGSIGVMAVVYDTSGAYALEGIKVHMISTGPQKGALADGTPVLPEQLASLQQRVNDIDAFFKAAVTQGRGMTPEQLAAVSTGEVWIADKAKAMGLVDAVQPFQATYQALLGEVGRRADAGNTHRRLRMARVSDHAQTR